MEEGRQRRVVIPDDPGVLRRALELTAVWTLSVQTVLSVFSESPETFIVAGAGPLDIVTFVLVLVLAPPAAALAFEQLVGLAGSTPRVVLHLVLLALGATAIALEVLARATSLGTGAITVLAALAGLGLVLLYLVAEWSRQWLRYLAIATPIVVVWFLFLSPSSQLLSSTSAAVADTGRGTEASVVFVVLDEFPTESLLDGEGGIDAELYPNLAALSETGTWYRNATTVTDRTVNSTPAILTGNRPTDPDEAPTAANFPQSLFTLLGGSHEVAASEVLPICPADVCEQDHPAHPIGELLGQAVDIWSQRRAESDTLTAPIFPAHDDATEQLRRLDEFTADIEGDGPRLDFIHLLLPHSPWHLLGDGTRYDDPEPTFGLALQPFGVWQNQEVAERARQRHVLQLMALDTHLGALFDHLRATGRWDDTLVVITGDHGISFAAGTSPRTWEAANADQVLFTPLFVKAPGQTRGGPDDRPMQTIDILPTVADLLGLDLPWSVEGHPAAEIGDDAPRRAHWPGDGRDDEDSRVVDPRLFDTVLSRSARGDTGADPETLWSSPDHLDLVGRPLDDLAMVDGDGELDLVLPDLPYPAPDEDAPAQVYVLGRVTGLEPDELVVVAVNGRVAAVSAPFDLEDGTWLGALTDPALHHAGLNDLAFFSLDADADDGPLRRITVAD